MQVLSVAEEVAPSAPRLSLSLARTAEEVREVQRLRYKIFIEAAGLAMLSNEEGIDADEFDAYCDHIIVRDSNTLKVVGTYRVLNPSGARRLGRLYSENEFDLSRLANLRGRMVEAGRACIHPAYRGGAVLMLLWSGLADYVRRERCEYLIGCASISLTDGGGNARAVYHALTKTHLAPSEYHVTPLLPFPIAEVNAADKHCVPPLLKGYMRSGAWICGAPAWDKEFQCADVFLLLHLDRLENRYAKRYLTEMP